MKKEGATVPPLNGNRSKLSFGSERISGGL